MDFLCNQVKNFGSFHLTTACTLFSKVICLCLPIDHKHCIGWYCTGFIYGYVVRRLVIIIIIIITSSDDIQPSTLLSNQSPSGLIL